MQTLLFFFVLCTLTLSSNEIIHHHHTHLISSNNELLTQYNEIKEQHSNHFSFAISQPENYLLYHLTARELLQILHPQNVTEEQLKNWVFFSYPNCRAPKSVQELHHRFPVSDKYYHESWDIPCFLFLATPELCSVKDLKNVKKRFSILNGEGMFQMSANLEELFTNAKLPAYLVEEELDELNDIVSQEIRLKEMITQVLIPKNSPLSISGSWYPLSLFRKL